MMFNALEFMAKSSMLFLLVAPVDASCDDVLVIGPVRIGMNNEEVVRLLDRPRVIKNRTGFIRTAYYYDRLIVEFDEDMRVAGVESSNSRYCLEERLCPGDDFRAASGKIRAANSTSDEKKITINGDGCWGSAVAKSGLIDRVSIRCQP